MTPRETSITKRLPLGTNAKLRRRFMVIDEPVKSNIRVGLLLEVLDKLAEDAALRYAREVYPEARVVTAAMDDLKVCGPPDIDCDIVLLARINYVGRTSMEVGIRLEQPGGTAPRHVGSCYFTMVARLREGDAERSVPLPPLTFEDAQDEQRAQRAVERRSKRSRQKESDLPSPEEYSLLHKLHHEAELAQGPVLLPRELVTSGWERTYPEHENVPQKIFGGYVAHRAYMYAHICAELVADRRALLVSSDRIDFYQPVRMGDKLQFLSRVTFTGRSSICVETAITRISRDRAMTALSNNCVFTFVNVDADLNLLAVPRVFPTTYSEDIRYLDGFRRHEAYEKKRAGRQGVRSDG